MNVIILFSGQGLQHSKHIEEIRKLATPSQYQHLLTTLSDIFGSSTLNGDIYQNKIAQPFIFSLQYLRWQQLQQWLDTPIAFAGYSLGEVSAYCCSSQMDFVDGSAMIQTRADLMQADITRPCGMLAIQGLNTQQIALLLDKTQTFLAIQMTASQVIIGGYRENLIQSAEFAMQSGATNISWLKVSIPSHTPLLHTANHKFYKYLNALNLPNAKIPIISATSGVRYQNSSKAVDIMSYQIDHCLDWQLCMENIQEYLPDCILEIGPGNALSRMITNVLPHIPCRSYDDFRDIDGLQYWFEKNIS